MFVRPWPILIRGLKRDVKTYCFVWLFLMFAYIHLIHLHENGQSKCKKLLDDGNIGHYVLTCMLINTSFLLDQCTFVCGGREYLFYFIFS